MPPSATVLGGIFLLVALYCGLDPFNHRPTYGFPDLVSHKVEMPSWFKLPNHRDSQNLLQKSEVKFLDELQGPESVAFDPMGRGPYTGVADGRVLFWNGEAWTEFAYTSSNRSVCKHHPTIPGYMKTEHICGRPLGLRFHKKTGEMYIADPYFGIMRVGPEGGVATPLATEAEGIPINFANDLDVDEDGNVYFSDTSTRYHRRNFMQLVLSAENSGRILKYDPTTKQTTVLMKNLQFPNGITLAKDGNSFIYAEGCPGKLGRYWLKGPKAGTSELFAFMPGFPDNIRTNDKGEIWVALFCRRNLFHHILWVYPRLRDFVLSLPIPVRYQYKFILGQKMHAVVAKYGPDGDLRQILEDRDGKVVRGLSEVEEHDGKLWMGSVLMNFMAVYDLNSS